MIQQTENFLPQHFLALAFEKHLIIRKLITTSICSPHVVATFTEFSLETNRRQIHKYNQYCHKIVYQKVTMLLWTVFSYIARLATLSSVINFWTQIFLKLQNYLN